MRHFTIVAACVVALPAFAQEPAKDAAGDPLPKGAVARYGTERMKNLDGFGTARLHPNGTQVIATANGKPSLFDPATGTEVGPFANGGGRNIAHLSADSSRAVNSTFNGVSVWSCETGKAVYELKRPLGYDDSLFLSGDGKWLAVGGRADEKDKKKPVAVTVYDVDGQKEAASLTVAQNQSARMALSGDGKRGVSWGYHFEQGKPGEEPDEDKNPSRLLQFWDVSGKKELGQARLPAGYGIASVAITAAGDLCAASTGDGAVCLFDVATGKKVKELLGRSRVGLNLTFSADGKSLASAASDGAVQLWDVASGKSLGVAPPPVAQDYMTVSSVVFTGPGKAIALAQLNSSAVVWEVPSGKVITPVVGHQLPVTGLVFTAEKELISAAYNGEVIRWDAAGKRVAVAADTFGGAPQISVYDFDGGKKTHTFKGHLRGVSAMTFSADGKTLATASNDTTILLWDLTKD